MLSLVQSLPSPSIGKLSIGPLQLSAYGLMIALGVIAATMLASRRLERIGAGTSEEMQSVAMWSVFGGLIGARLYHVVTAWELFGDDLWRIPMVWKGGLGIPGGLLGGVAAGGFVVRRRGLSLPAVLTAVAPAIPLAQAIGRWGNWWNQELFGRPTTLPWGLEISADKTPSGFSDAVLFHPTFLYESLWSLALCAALLAVDRYRPLRPGRLFALYLAGYFAGRFWIEGLRIDPTHTIGALRLNQWVALIVVVTALGYLAVDARRHRDDDRERDQPTGGAACSPLAEASPPSQ